MAIFRSGMLVYETGKLPPSVNGWGLSDRADYLYFTPHTCLHACIPHNMHKVMHAKTDYFYTLIHIVHTQSYTYTCNPLGRNTPGTM